MREPRWRQEGQEPDYRFSLANERTFLAWIRTALALLAGGVLLDQFSTKLQPHIAVLILAIVLGALAAVLLRAWPTCAGAPTRSRCATRAACRAPWRSRCSPRSRWRSPRVIALLLALQ